jgi:uncharacterized protein
MTSSGAYDRPAGGAVAGGAADRAADEAVAAGLLGRLQDLVEDLRRAGLPVGISGYVEAAAALGHVDVGEREQVRAGLCATLVTRAEDLAVFDTLFDARFALTRATTGSAAPGTGPLRDRLVAALADDDLGTLASLADEAVASHAGFDTATGSPRYRLSRTLRALDAGTLARDALRTRRATGQREGLSDLGNRTGTAAAFDRFLAALAGSIARRDAEDRPRAGAYQHERVEDLDFMAVSSDELRRVREAVRPLARRLAARLARTRHPRLGALDVRRTIRRSLSSGGVPLDPDFRRRHPRRPDLWVLCDVSGSVAETARFTVNLLAAIHDEVPRLRSFLFVDDLVEVTGLLAARRHELDPFSLVAGAGAPLGGRRSDWGAALGRFHDDHLGDLSPRSVVLVTGDARTHDHDPRPDVVTALARHCRALWLFDPEPPGEWWIADSAVGPYTAAGMQVREVRTLAQLTTAIEDVLRSS